MSVHQILDGVGGGVLCEFPIAEPLFSHPTHEPHPSYAETPVSYDRHGGNDYAAERSRLTKMNYRVEFANARDLGTAQARAARSFKKLEDVRGQRIVGHQVIESLVGRFDEGKRIKRTELEQPFALLIGDHRFAPSALLTIKPSERTDKPFTLTAHELVIPEVSGPWNPVQKSHAKDVVARLRSAIDARQGHAPASASPPKLHLSPGATNT